MAGKTFVNGSVLTDTDINTYLNNPDANGRNLIHNGAMQVAQRSTSVTGIVASGYLTADRWATEYATAGTWTQTVTADAPAGSGLTNSLKMLCTTANASLSAGSILSIVQKIEGYDVQRVAKGSASAKALTLSFWVKSNVLGTYTILVYDASNTRMTSFSYTIAASGTWEKKTILIPADATGAFTNSNASALEIYMHLAAGTSSTSGALASTWAAYNAANRAVGQVNVAAATNNYWQVTGVQLETSTVATPFEFEDYATTLRKCQRYYWRSASDASNLYAQFGFGSPNTATAALCAVSHPVPMRAAPSSVDFANLGFTNYGTTGYAITAVVIAGTRSSVTQTMVQITSSGMTAGQFGFLNANNSSSAYIGFSADL